MSRKERPAMTKPREKTREELTAEIEEGKKKIRQFENREKIIKQKLSVEERKARNHRLCKRGGFMESLVPELFHYHSAKAFFNPEVFGVIGQNVLVVSPNKQDNQPTYEAHAIQWHLPIVVWILPAYLLETFSCIYQRFSCL